MTHNSNVKLCTPETFIDVISIFVGDV